MARRIQVGNIAQDIHGDGLYQVRARAALPILVRQAEAGHEITYSALAEELEMPNARNLDYVLGSIGQTLNSLGRQWREVLPPIQSLVVNKNTGLPGNGIEPFLYGRNFATLSKLEKRRVIEGTFAGIFAFPRWREVLAALGLQPFPFDSGVVARATGFDGGESPEHRDLKMLIALNPALVGLPVNFAPGVTEFSLPSGDSIDVFFENASEWIGIEVKSYRSPLADVERGLFQCVKYRAVLEAMSRLGHPVDVRVILALGGPLPGSLAAMKNTLGIEVVDNIGELNALNVAEDIV